MWTQRREKGFGNKVWGSEHLEIDESREISKGDRGVAKVMGEKQGECAATEVKKFTVRFKKEGGSALWNALEKSNTIRTGE